MNGISVSHRQLLLLLSCRESITQRGNQSDRVLAISIIRPYLGPPREY